MRLLLNDGSRGAELNELYEGALSEAVELLVVTAYLTEWSPKVRLRPEGGYPLRASRHNILWLPGLSRRDGRVRPADETPVARRGGRRRLLHESVEKQPA